MVIRHNIPMMNAYRNYTINAKLAAKAMQRLSTGYRINSAADDPAGLAISEKMRGQIRGLRMAATNARQSIAMLQTAEGGLNETHAILQRMRELCVQSANGTYQPEDRELLNIEYRNLAEAIGGIASSTHYNGIKLLDGTAGGEKGEDSYSHLGVDALDVGGNVNGELKFNLREDATNVFTITCQIDGKVIGTEQVSGSLTEAKFYDENGEEIKLTFTIGVLKSGSIGGTQIKNGNIDYSKTTGATTEDQVYFQIGANGNADQRISSMLGNMGHENLGDLKNGFTLDKTDILTPENARSALEAVEKAVKQVSSQRASIGAQINRLEFTIENLENSAENLEAAESVIRDADMAQEMMNFTKYSILMQAAQAMMAQAANLPKALIQMLWAM